MKNIATREAVNFFEVERGEHLAVRYQALETRRILFDQVHHAVGVNIPSHLPIGVPQFVRRVLQKNSHDVLARRRDGIVVCGGNRHFDQRNSDGLPVFRVVPRVLDIIDAGQMCMVVL